MALYLAIGRRRTPSMVRMGPPGAFSPQSSTIGFPQQVFYRRHTANPCGFLTELRKSGPSPERALSAWSAHCERPSRIF